MEQSNSLINFLNDLMSSSCSIEEDGDDLKIEFTNESSNSFSAKHKEKINLNIANNKTILISNYENTIPFIVGVQSYFNKVKGNRIRYNNCVIFLSNEEYLLVNGDEILSNSKKKNIKNIVNHTHQYLSLYHLFETNKDLVEHILPTSEGEQLIVINKQTFKTVSSILFKKKCLNYLSLDFETIDLELFSEKIKIIEWLSCFKEELCKFSDNQSNSTFDKLYQNLNYLINVSEKNYQLYITKFSFEKVLNIYKDQKEKYFNSLNSINEKIAGQITSIPLTLGASLFALFQLNNIKQINIIILIVSIYSIFIIYLIITYLIDLNNIKQESKKDRNILKSKYPTIYNDIEEHFRTSDKKASLIRYLGISIIVILIISIFLIYFFFRVKS